MITTVDISKRHKEWRKMAFYLGATDDNVDDILQDFYIKIFEIETNEGNLNRIVGENGKIQTMFIFKIIQSKVVDEFRKQKKETNNFDEIFDECDCIEIEPVDTYSILMAEIKNVIDGMREYDQMLLELYFVYGFTFREIERRTSIPTRSVFNIVKNAKETIKKQTEKLYEQHKANEKERETERRTWRHHRQNNGIDWDKEGS